jgi:RimJ/RimL family protein N-acetyltransferase
MVGSLTEAAHPGGVLRVRRFPELTLSTPRLDVRGLVVADAPEVERVFNDRQTRRWMPLPANSGPVNCVAWCGELADERRNSGAGDHYAVIRREDERLVGCLWSKRTDWVARSTEVWVAVRPSARGFGVAAEALDGLTVALILEQGFQRVEMRVAAGNTASRRVAEKAGFTYEGILRNAGCVHNGRVDLEMWSLVAADLR